MANEVKVVGRWIDGISAEVKKTTSTLKQEFSGANLAALALGGVAGVTLAGAFSALAQQMHECSQEAIDQERADYGLMNAMKAASNYSDGAYKSFKEQANALQYLTRYTDDQIESVQALALNLRVSADRVQDYTRAAATLATMLGTDVNSAMTMIVRAMNDAGGRLKGLVGDFRDVEDLVARINAKSKDVLENSMGPYERSINKVKKDIMELKELLGGMAVSGENFSLSMHKVVLELEAYLSGQLNYFRQRDTGWTPDQMRTRTGGSAQHDWFTPPGKNLQDLLGGANKDDAAWWTQWRMALEQMTASRGGGGTSTKKGSGGLSIDQEIAWQQMQAQFMAPYTRQPYGGPTNRRVNLPWTAGDQAGIDSAMGPFWDQQKKLDDAKKAIADIANELGGIGEAATAAALRGQNAFEALGNGIENMIIRVLSKAVGSGIEDIASKLLWEGARGRLGVH